MTDRDDHRPSTTFVLAQVRAMVGGFERCLTERPPPEHCRSDLLHHGRVLRELERRAAAYDGLVELVRSSSETLSVAATGSTCSETAGELIVESSRLISALSDLGEL